jgi:hypothetical protein
MKISLPAEFDELEETASAVPMFHKHHAYPFTGFVVNVSCRSEVHKDAKDRCMCVVIPIGQYDRGELVIEELGLVVDLRPGQFLAFKSKYLTHYNLDFEGRRVSIVLQTDEDIDTSIERREFYKKHELAH